MEWVKIYSRFFFNLNEKNNIFKVFCKEGKNVVYVIFFFSFKFVKFFLFEEFFLSLFWGFFVSVRFYFFVW